MEDPFLNKLQFIIYKKRQKVKKGRGVAEQRARSGGALMANRPSKRKRVNAIHRGPDGSAFENW